MDSFESPDHNTSSRQRDRDDYSYRDRRDSPDRRRDRRRSRSPAGIDRYQPERAPRDDYRSARNYDGARRDRRRSPHDRGPPAIDRYVPGQDQAILTVNPLPDPLKLDYQVGFTWFAEWWRAEQRIKEEKERVKTGRAPRIKGERESREEQAAERPKIQAAYDQYKGDLQKAQAQTFVRQHKDEDWFREKYVAEVRNVFRPKVLELRKTAYAQFETDLANGVFDDFTLEGIYKTEANGLGGTVEKEEGETIGAAEVLQTGDLLPARGGDLRDPAALQPTLLLKTIAPTVTRESLEKLAREHLGEGPGGFKHLSLSDPNPGKRYYRIGWYMLDADATQVDEDMTDTLEAEQPGDGDAVSKSGQGSMLAIAEDALEKINSKTIEDAERGNFTIHCGVHRPPDAPRKKALWDLFSAPERIERDLDLATRLVRRYDNELGEEIFGVARIMARVDELVERGSLEVQVPQEPLGNMDETIDDGEIEEPRVIDEDEQDDKELLTHKKQLDILVEYLRRVHNACFFCVFESDSVHELQRKCPGGHLRRPRASLTSAAKDIARASANGEPYPLKKNGTTKEPSGRNGDNGDDVDVDMAEPESPSDDRNKFSKPAGKSAQQLQRAWNWVKTFEEKVLQILEPDNADLRKLGGTPVEEGVEEEMPKFVKQEDVSKFRCKVPECTKLFKGVDFWRKHVETRHADFYATIQNEIELVNAYVMDPSHIAPSRSDANSNGHFPANNNGMPTGTPRGFSLHSHMPAGFAPPGMPPGAFIPGGWSMAAGTGPVRSHGGARGGGNGYRNNGPYARPDGRNGRLPSFSGRPGGTFEASISPFQATQGRTMRSYEDLDAAGPAAKEEELDY